jgi:hypothetical protein
MERIRFRPTFRAACHRAVYPAVRRAVRMERVGGGSCGAGAQARLPESESLKLALMWGKPPFLT